MFEEALIHVRTISLSFSEGKKEESFFKGPWTNRRISNGPTADQSKSQKAYWAATCFVAAGDSAAQGIRILWAFWFLGPQG